MNIKGRITAPLLNYEIDTNFDVCILYSPNGSGKSKLMQNIQSPDESKLEIAIIPPERGGNVEMNMSTVQQERNKTESYQHKRKNQVNDYRQRAIAQINVYTNVLADAIRAKASKSEFPYIEKKLEEIFPKYIFDIRAAEGIKVSIISKDEIIPLSLDALSTSEADVISLAIDIICRAIMFKLNKSDSSLLIMIDEPTAYMNIDTTARFAQFILELAGSHQLKFLIATNDHELISSLDFYKEKKKVDIVTFSVNGSTNQKELHLDHSDNIVSGFVTQGKFLSKRPIFVEGSDDQYIWQRASRIPGGPSVIAVDVGGGREVKPTLDGIELLAEASEEKRLKALGITDGDDPVTYRNDKRKSTKGFNLCCNEIENLYLSDTALKILKTDWKTVKVKAKSRKALSALTRPNFSRRKADIKNIIVSISEVIDPQKRDWREIVAKALVKAKEDSEDIKDWIGKDFCELIFEVVEE